LLGTGRSSEGSLQAQIGSQPGINFYQTMSTSQQADKRIHELIDGRMFNGFLLDLHSRFDRAKEIQLLQICSNGGQGSTRRKMVRCWCDRLVHSDAPSHASWFYFFHEIIVITFLLSLASSSVVTISCC
jgi:hypothetical protein